MVIIYAEPGPEDLALPVPFLKIKGSGLRTGAFTVSRVPALCVAEWIASVQEGRRKNQKNATVD